MIKFKVYKRITIDEEYGDSHYWTVGGAELCKKPRVIGNTLCYKLMAGLYIFYVSEDVLNELVRLDLVEPYEDVPVYNFSVMVLHIGIDVYKRMAFSIDNSTISRMKTALKKVNANPKRVCVKRYSCTRDKDISSDRINAELSLEEVFHIDLENRKIIYRHGSYISDTANPLCRVYNYETLLEALSEELDRVYCNVIDLMRQYSKVGGYSMLSSTMYKSKYDFSYIE